MDNNLKFGVADDGLAGRGSFTNATINSDSCSSPSLTMIFRDSFTPMRRNICYHILQETIRLPINNQMRLYKGCLHRQRSSKWIGPLVCNVERLSHNIPLLESSFVHGDISSFHKITSRCLIQQLAWYLHEASGWQLYFQHSQLRRE